MFTTEREIIFLLQASVDGFLHVSCTRLDQKGTIILLQSDVGVDVVETTTTTNAQVAAREEFARPSKKRQQLMVTGEMRWNYILVHTCIKILIHVVYEL